MTDGAKCVEVSLELTSGGKVQIVQFKLSNDFSLSYGEKYAIPLEWDEEQKDAFVEDRIEKIKECIETYAQVEQDALLDSSDWAGK